MTLEERFAQKLEIEAEAFSIPEVTREERTEAQALYTAIMTDTVLEDEE